MSTKFSSAPRIWPALIALALIVAGCTSVTPAPEARPPAAAVPAALPLESSAAPEARPPHATATTQPSEPQTVAAIPSATPLVASAEASPTSLIAGRDLEEFEASMNLQTWIAAIEFGESDLAHQIYRLDAGGAKPGEILGHVVALQHFIESAEDPANTPFGTYLGFHAVTGSYLVAPGRRVGIALMQFEHATVCFRADLAYVRTIWSIERWEPITWEVCQPEIARLPPQVRSEWGDVLP